MIFKDKTYDEERALYGIESAEISGCTFDGPADGESALKECRDIVVSNCDFRLRYPFWHVDNAEIINCRMTETCRAALWYDRGIRITDSKLHGIKALRECADIKLNGCDIDSQEFGWRCSEISIEDTNLNSQYAFFESKEMNISGFEMTGKYSFQYVENVTVNNSRLKTKDAFWHAKNVTVCDTVLEGEYLGWYSENLKLVRCHIKGTQPLCYCKGLILEDCTMEDTDLSFEKSDVNATVSGNIVSVKNPVSGKIYADSIDEIIWDDQHKKMSSCEIRTLSLV